MPSHPVHGGHGPTPISPPSSSGSLVHGIDSTPPVAITPPSSPGSLVHGIDPTHTPPPVTRSPDLAPVAPSAEGTQPTGRFRSSPAQPSADEPFKLELELKDARGRPLEPAIMHEKQVHLLVVSDDLADFQHLHPVRERPGVFKIDMTVPRGRSYRTFGEFTAPGAETPTVVASTIGTSDPRSPAVPLRIDLSDKHIGSSIVGLRGAESLKAGEESAFEVHVSDAKSGATPKDLNPWLGAPAHGVIVDAKARGLVHAHAMKADAPMTGMQQHGASAEGHAPTFMFHAKFEQPGLHKIWVQFDRGGEVITAPFVVDVAR